LYQGTTSVVPKNPVLYQGTTSVVPQNPVLYQGTTSVVPKRSREAPSLLPQAVVGASRCAFLAHWGSNPTGVRRANATYVRSFA
jgi:hypothetical protein